MRISVSGLVETEEALRALQERLTDLTPVMEVAASDTTTLIDDSFDSESSPDGSPWAPHRAATLSIRANKRRSGASRRRSRGLATGARILQDSLRLRRSITGSAFSSGFAFGTNVPYGTPHQLGASIRVFGNEKAPATIPARPFLPVTGSRGQYQLMTSGRAGEHWTRVRSMIERYILTGEID